MRQNYTSEYVKSLILPCIYVMDLNTEKGACQVCKIALADLGGHAQHMPPLRAQILLF